LHLGNLRTALVAWLAARSAGGRFLVRMEDLDRVTSSRLDERRQLDDLARFGIDHDGEVVRQSERFERYRAAIDALAAHDLVYPCYCSRREIREAPHAPHGAPGAYPGTCRELTAGERRAREAGGRRPALRLRTDHERIELVDRIAGPFEGVVDDVVLQRNDGVPAYNLAVVVDDAAQGVTQVVRGDDLLDSTPRQIHLARLLELAVPEYAHVPLVLAPDGTRLAKRHGAVTLDELANAGVDADGIRSMLAVSLELASPGEAPTLGQLLERFDLASVPKEPWVYASS
jgi:glutamyl-tRNA synthetase